MSTASCNSSSVIRGRFTTLIIALLTGIETAALVVLILLDVGCFAIRNALTLRQDLTEKEHPIAIVEFGCYENYILILHGDAPFK